MPDTPQTQSFRKFTATADAAGDAAFANKLRSSAVVIRGNPETLLPWDELPVEERAFVLLLKIPRKFQDVENCGAVPATRAVAMLRGLHAAEMLDSQDSKLARALIPVEVRKALAEAKGQQVVTKKLVANVYRPMVDGVGGVTSDISSMGPGVEFVDAMPSSKTPMPPPKPAAPAIPPEIVALMADADAIFPDLAKMDHFKMLGLKRDAGDDAVKDAHLAAMKKWHPDRAASFPKAAEYTQKLQAIFSAVQTAHTAIAEKGARETYLKDLVRKENNAVVKARQESVELARKEAEAGKLAMVKKAYAQAEAHYKKASELDELAAEYKVESAWAHALNPSLPEVERRQESIAVLRELGKVSKYADTFYKLGCIMRLHGDNNLMEVAFRRCVAMDKNHTEAVRELRIHEQRQERQKALEEAARNNPQDQASGLLGKLFKKS